MEGPVPPGPGRRDLGTLVLRTTWKPSLQGRSRIIANSNSERLNRKSGLSSAYPPSRPATICGMRLAWAIMVTLV